MTSSIRDLLENKPTCSNMKGPYDDHSLGESLSPSQIRMFDHAKHPDTGVLTTFYMDNTEIGVMPSQGTSPYLLIFTQEGYAASKEKTSPVMARAEEQENMLGEIAKKLADIYGAYDEILVKQGRAYIPLLEEASSQKIALFVEKLESYGNIEPITGFVSLYAVQPLLTNLCSSESR